MLGNLSLAENSLTSDGADLITLAWETISIHFTAMTPFLPQLLVPGSVSFVLLERQILQQVTPVVSGFYKASPQERPLLLFSNADQWVGVYIEYKFQTPIATHLQGLANHLAQNITDPIPRNPASWPMGRSQSWCCMKFGCRSWASPTPRPWRTKPALSSGHFRGS
ncbi:taste receptor cell protein 1-like [Symphalangus syndactylus]|uniref:taste receptor cell protein 1-like n=1 Tax=Symphalangus syndactylus TaxID=9590 RepID=UPI003004844A